MAPVNHTSPIALGIKLSDTIDRKRHTLNIHRKIDFPHRTLYFSQTITMSYLAAHSCSVPLFVTYPRLNQITHFQRDRAQLVAPPPRTDQIIALVLTLDDMEYNRGSRVRMSSLSESFISLDPTALSAVIVYRLKRRLNPSDITLREDNIVYLCCPKYCIDADSTMACTSSCLGAIPSGGSPTPCCAYSIPFIAAIVASFSSTFSSSSTISQHRSGCLY